MKRSVLIIVAALVCVSAYVLLDNSNDISAEDPVYSGTCGKDVNFNFNEGTLTISGSGAMENYSETGAPWNSYKAQITSVVIGDTVTSIGNYAFCNCTALTSVTIGSGVTSIGESAFEGCSSLVTITIPDGVKTLSRYAFYKCGALTEVKISKSVTSIGSYVFDCCKALTKIEVDGENTAYSSADGVLFDKKQKYLVQYPAGKTDTSYTVPDTVKSVNSFTNCKFLKTVDLKSVEYIPSGGFRGCTALTTVDVGAVTEIQGEAFYGCAALKTINLRSATFIGSDAFSGCSSLTSVEIPSTVTNIGSTVFWDCAALISITVADTNTKYSSVGGVLFDENQTNLIQYPASKPETSFDVPTTTTSISSFAFRNCAILTSVDLGSVTTIGQSAFDGCTALTRITLGESLTNIDKYAFSDCTSLTEITIPKLVTEIGDYAFWNCASLTKIDVDDKNEIYSDIDGVLFSNTEYNLIKYPAAKTDSSYEVPKSVGYIYGDAFWGCHNLQSFSVAAENSKYYQIGGVLCHNEEFDGDTSYYIDAYPAGKTESSYTIPDTITGFDSYFVFCGSKNLKTVVLNASIRVESASCVALAYCPALETIDVSKNSKYTFKEKVLYGNGGKDLLLCLSTKSGEYTIPEEVANIKSYAFVNASKITALNIPDSVEKIWNYTFYVPDYGDFGCSSLCRITFGNGLSSIGNSAFDDIYFYADGNSISATAENLKGKTFYLCNETLKTGFDPEIPEEGHELVADSATGGKKCTLCGKTFANQSGTGTGEGTGTSGDSGSGTGTSGDSGSGTGTSGDSGSGTGTSGDSGSGTGTGEGSGTSGGDTSGGSDVNTGECGKNVTYSFDNGTLTISGTGAMADYSADGAPWNSIKTQITSVVIGAEVTSVGACSFNGCTALTSVTLGGAKTIGASAFSGCTTLATIDLSSAGTINDYAFSGCTSIGSVTFNGSGLGSYAFSNCTSLTTVELGAEMDVGNYLFSGCTALTSVDLGPITSIGSYMFEYCTALPTITIPTTVEYIESSAFWDCTSLTEFKVSGNEYYYATDGVLFDKDHELMIYPSMKSGTTYEVPANVVYIYPDAFYKSINLQSITVPEGNSKYCSEGGVVYTKDLKTLVAYPNGKPESTYTVPESLDDSQSWYVFYGCNNLKTVALPDSFDLTSKTMVISLAFSPALEKVEVKDTNEKYKNVDNVLFSKNGKALILCPAAKSGEYTVPDGTETISLYAFAGAGKITAVTIPNSVTTLEESVFEGRANDMPGTKSLCRVTIGNGLINVHEYAFYRISLYGADGKPVAITADDLKGKTFAICNDTMKTGFVFDIPAEGHILVDDAASGAKKCTICEKVISDKSDSGTGTSGDSGSGTSGGSGEGTGTSGDSGTTTGGDDTQPEVTDSTGKCGKDATYAFEASTGTLTIGGTGAMENYSETGAPWNTYKTQIKSVVIGDGVTSIGNYAFYGCTGITDLKIGSAVRSIGTGAFACCSSLSKVDIPASVIGLGDYAFLGCTSVTEYNVPSGNEKLESESGVLFNKGKTVLYQYPSKKAGATYTISKDVVNIHKDAFYGCYSLTSIDVESGNTDFCSVDGVVYTFDKTTLVAYPAGKTDATYTIPDNVTGARSCYAFNGNRNLTKVTLPDAFDLSDSGTKLALAYSPALENITVSENNGKYKTVDGVVFTKDGKTLVLYPAAKAGEYTVPGETETIEEYAFANAGGLTVLNISDSVKNISSKAFQGQIFGGFGCSSLYKVAFGNGLNEIAADAFEKIGFKADGKAVTVTADSLKGKTFYLCNGTLDTGFALGDSAEGHALVDVAAADGLKAHQHCSICGKNFLDGKLASDDDLKAKNDDGGISTSTAVTVGVGSILAILVLIGAYMYYRRMNC